MDLKEYFEEERVINCKTKGQADCLMAILHDLGFKWNGYTVGIDDNDDRFLLVGNSKFKESKWCCYRTVPRGSGGAVSYGSYDWFKRQGYKIIEFESIGDDGDGGITRVLVQPKEVDEPDEPKHSKDDYSSMIQAMMQ